MPSRSSSKSSYAIFSSVRCSADANMLESCTSGRIRSMKDQEGRLQYLVKNVLCQQRKNINNIPDGKLKYNSQQQRRPQRPPRPAKLVCGFFKKK